MCLVAGLLSSPASAGRATLTVDVGAPGSPVSPMLYGIFFEEINHAGDGGLHAELVRNRSLEDADTPEGWSAVTSGGAEAGISLDTDQSLNAANPHCLRLQIVRIGEGRAGAANEGYWGIAVRKGAEYELSLFARAEGLRGGVVVSLEGADGKVHAHRRIEELTADWQRFSCRLKAGDTDPAARLVIAATAPGTVWLDVVSLFPRDTWKRRPNGLRADLAQMLAGMRPAFVRFPGGCFVEGDQLANAFRWKQTIGDIADRPGHSNLWGYRSTDGLGYHEYLQMCEDLGAEPVFVINCGMAHGGVVPLDQMDEWVQDALDAVEYANGPVDSTWGAARARNGHPRPFGLKYMEIGNENGGPPYEERYALFQRALKARYPGVQLICDGRVSSAPMDIVDEHYYSSPEWFAANADRYDRADRQGPRIYVGEYAVTQSCGQGNLRAALAEAAFMTGLERNSDLVRMASYAPLFVNVNNRAWNPDAIGFDSARCYGTPSYYVQQLFSRHRADVVLPTELVCAASPVEARGAVGLGTWATQAEFRDVRVTRGEQTLYASDFASQAAGWRPGHGDWSVEGGAYRQMSLDTDCRAAVGDPDWGDVTYSLQARKVSGAEGFLIMFRVRDDNNWLWWNIGGWGNVRHAIEKCTGGAKTILGEAVPGSVEVGQWYDIRIELRGPRIRCYLDGQLIHDVQDSAAMPMAAVAGRDTHTGEIILKVVNVSDEAQRTDVALQGAQQIASHGAAIVLTSGTPEDQNSLDEPTKVAPVTTQVGRLGASFRYTFPAHSLTILRVQAQ